MGLQSESGVVDAQVLVAQVNVEQACGRPAPSPSLLTLARSPPPPPPPLRLAVLCFATSKICSATSDAASRRTLGRRPFTHEVTLTAASRRPELHSTTSFPLSTTAYGSGTRGRQEEEATSDGG